MITKSRTIVGFICPVCGNAQTQTASLFDRTSRQLSCEECGNSVGEIVPAETGNCQIRILCVDCFLPHTFTVSSAKFWQSDRLLFNCPDSEELLLAAGDREAVEDALEESCYPEEFNQ